jgi:hypothetical protein
LIGSLSRQLVERNAITGSRGRRVKLEPGARCRGAPPAAAWSWSSLGLPGVAVPRCLDAAEEGVEAGGESLVAVAGPDVLAEGGQAGEAVGRRWPEEGMQLVPGRGVLGALFVDDSPVRHSAMT